MRILLVYPTPDIAPFYIQTPLGILYLAAALESQHKVRIYDGNVDDESLTSVVAEFDPDAIGISFTTGCVETSFSIVQKFKHHDRRRIMIAGGIHPTYCPDSCLDAGFDLVARGEVEDTFADFLTHIESRADFLDGNGEPPPGYFYKGKSDEVIDTGIARCSDVDRLAPARHLVPSKYHERYIHGVLMGSRGCHFGCAFCASARTGYRQRDPSKVADELEYIVRAEGHPVIHFADDIFTFNPEWVKELCQQIIERKISCEWSINSRSDIKPKHWDMFDWMKRAGCRIVAFGIESANQASLNASKKGLRVNKIIPVLNRAREAGLKIRCNLMVGLPGADLEGHKVTIDLVENILPEQIIVSLTVPYPGSTMGAYPERFGIRLKSRDWTTVLQNVFIDVEKFSEVIEYESISHQEILLFEELLRSRLKPYGYKTASERPGSGDRMIKTFLDYPKLPPLRYREPPKSTTPMLSLA